MNKGVTEPVCNVARSKGNAGGGTETGFRFYGELQERTLLV